MQNKEQLCSELLWLIRKLIQLCAAVKQLGAEKAHVELQDSIEYAIKAYTELRMYNV